MTGPCKIIKLSEVFQKEEIMVAVKLTEVSSKKEWLVAVNLTEVFFKRRTEV